MSSENMERKANGNDKSVKAESKKKYIHDGDKEIQSATKYNNKIGYSCQYCCEILPDKFTSIKHMEVCLREDKINIILQEKLTTNNNETEQDKLYAEQQLSVNNIENESERVHTNVNQVNKDASIYDYNEVDDSEDERDLKENSEEVLNNKQCKHCQALFDNPLDLLRHTRDCHSFPRTVLPPDEIEKYFDYPNRQYCPICEKPIKTRNFRSVFIKHLLVHTTGLTHECRVCKKKFRRRDHMRAHEKRHIVAA